MGPCHSQSCNGQTDTVRQPEEVCAEQCSKTVWDQSGSSACASLWGENNGEETLGAGGEHLLPWTPKQCCCCLHPCCRIGGAVSPWESYAYICSTAAEEPAGPCLTYEGIPQGALCALCGVQGSSCRSA